MRTYLPKRDMIERKWHLIDAKGRILGRLAVEVVIFLRGKNKVFYTNHIDCGDFVIVINMSKVIFTGKKISQKVYFSHSGHPGGVKLTPLSVMMEKNPTKILFKAVKGMLPKNRLASRQIKRLKIFKDNQHIHHAQVMCN
ncbi:MAG: 50S ribosomal protein L13 [Endomicrobium sp.]|jgi:large subunit ribosomal protein L13|nr:50S ribosomal protein L13 [Endomicrobium sp.]